MKICFVARVFSKNEEGARKKVPVIKGLYDAIDTLASGRQEFDSLQVVIPTNPAFVDCDFGGTAEVLRSEGFVSGNASVFETKHDLFCGSLNQAAVRALSAGCDHLMVVSPEVASYLKAENIMQMIEALKTDAKVSGLAINELAESVMEGRIANTLALWNIEALLSVGGFDLRASNARRDDRLQQFVRGQGANGGELFYPLAGVEETIPLCRLIDQYGKCIAPIRPATGGVWEEPTESEALARHRKKMASKWARQALMAGLVGADLDYLKTGLMA